MTQRVSSDMNMNDMNYWLRLREGQMNELNNQMASQTRIQRLRDDPLAAARSTRYQSLLLRMDTYSENVGYAQGVKASMEGHLRSAVDIVQRLREIAVQGANGIYSSEELSYMGEEVDAYLRELVAIANAQGGDGTTLFAGERTRSPAFRTMEGHVPGADGARITDVQYLGTIDRNMAEIDEGSYVPVSMPGNQAFWAENTAVVSTVDAAQYVVPTDGSIRVDGVEIPLRQGDNIHAVIGRINGANLAVRASVDPVYGSLVLESTSPHQLWLEDANGRTFQDLGVLGSAEERPPFNVAPSARQVGGSLFDMAIALRDGLYAGDSEAVGSIGLRGMDSALNNLLGSVAQIGSETERLDSTLARHEWEIPNVTEQNSRAVDLNLSEAVTRLSMLEMVHQAALATTARLSQNTLLNFLR